MTSLLQDSVCIVYILYVTDPVESWNLLKGRLQAAILFRLCPRIIVTKLSKGFQLRLFYLQRATKHGSILVRFLFCSFCLKRFSLLELSVSEEIERFGKKSGKCTGFLVESCFFRIQSPLPLRASFSWHLHREKTLTNYNWKDEGQLMLQISISYICRTVVVF